MIDLLEKKEIEPNCGLGKAFNYWLKRWEKLTLFLRVLGAPLDNNYAERVLKVPIKLRKSSMFYLSQKGARIAGIYMTLIHTAQLHGINPYDYLSALLKHPQEVAANPANWLPWTYQETLTRMKLQFAA